MVPEERKEIIDAFRHELEMFSKNKIDPLVNTVQRIGTRVIDHGERLAAHRQRIKDVEKDVGRVEKDVEGVEREVETVYDGLETAKESRRSDFNRILAIVVTALVAILAAVIGLG
jgi:chromosome segregation ATPase